MDWAQILVVLLAIVLLILVAAAIVLIVMFIRVSHQIRHVSQSALQTTKVVRRAIKRFKNMPSLLTIVKKVVSATKRKK